MAACRSRSALASALLLVGACAGAHPPATATAQSARGCSTLSAQILFDFETAPTASCTVEGEREFAVLISPEHAPPINPSPWYAFRYRSNAPLTVHLRYLGGKHRYRPVLTADDRSQMLEAAVTVDGSEATVTAPPGQGTISGQEIVDSARYRALRRRLSAGGVAQRLVLGESHDGRAITALRIGRADAPRLVVLLGRQHPPEVTGALAMEAFLETLVAQFAGDPASLRDVQVLAVPLLNPDGVARGHWRANLGGLDLNRDWGAFTQPETRAVRDWLDRLPSGIRPAAMVDFHSTTRNLFYVQGEEASEDQERFLARWLIGKEDAIPDYNFVIERRDANPGRGTAKNWFHTSYAIPAYTYEVGDETDRPAIARAASKLARDFVAALQPE